MHSMRCKVVASKAAGIIDGGWEADVMFIFNQKVILQHAALYVTCVCIEYKIQLNLNH